ncbi:MAG: hypothetical protein ABIA76_05630 [Candidatus Diapherotrites archaeon]
MFEDLTAQMDVDFFINYAQNFLNNVLAGDPTSIILLAIIAIILLVVVFGISAFLFGLIKRFFLFIVVGLSAYFFVSNYWEKISSQDMTIQLAVIGLIGLAFAIAAVATAVMSIKAHAKKRQDYKEPEEHKAPEFTPTQLQQPQAYTTQALTPQNLYNSIKDDRSLLAVLSYIIIAQFGVFSSKTISAPNPTTGMIFLVVFMVGAVIFIKTTYRSYLKGISHLVIASIFGLILSGILAIYWAEFPLETILSIQYFQTDALVAFVTGIAISLLMGSKN